MQNFQRVLLLAFMRSRLPFMENAVVESSTLNLTPEQRAALDTLAPDLLDALTAHITHCTIDKIHHLMRAASVPREYPQLRG